MASNPVSKITSRPPPKTENPLEQMVNAAGKFIKDVTTPRPANAATPPKNQRRGASSPTTGKSGAAPSGSNSQRKAASAPPPLMCSAKDRPPVAKAGRLLGSDKNGSVKTEVLHRFEYDQRVAGGSLRADNGLLGTGLLEQRDRTHQIVQHEVRLPRADNAGKTSRWEVHVQPVNEGRLRPNQHIFTSTHKLSERDFDSSPFGKTSKLRDNYERGVARLNHDSNRLPQASKKAGSAQPPGRWWIDQQARDVAGGFTGTATKILSAAASVPENTVKVASSLGNTGKSLVHIVTRGRTFKSEFNPIVTDKHSQYYNAPTGAERATAGVQEKINKPLGVDSGSAAYKLTEFVGPYLFLKRGAAGGGVQPKSGPGGRSQSGGTELPPASSRMPTPPSTMSKSAPSQPAGTAADVTLENLAALRQRMQITWNKDGAPTVRLKSGRSAPGIEKALSERFHVIKHDDGSMTLKRRHTRIAPEDVAALRQRLQVTKNIDGTPTVRLKSGSSAPGVEKALSERFHVIKHDDGSMTLKRRQ